MLLWDSQRVLQYLLRPVQKSTFQSIIYCFCVLLMLYGCEDAVGSRAREKGKWITGIGGPLLNNVQVTRDLVPTGFEFITTKCMDYSN